jgi:hypothetical protein
MQSIEKGSEKYSPIGFSMPLFYVSDLTLSKKTEKEIYFLTGKESIQSFSCVYQSSSGVTGFDSDNSGTSFLKDFLDDAWTWNFINNKAEALAESKDLLTSVRKNAFPQGIVIHAPTKEILEEFYKAARYADIIKVNKLRLKYGKPPNISNKPILFQDESDVIRPNSLDFLLTKSKGITLWGWAGEYGVYFNLLSASTQLFSKMSHILNNLNISITKLQSISELPVW